MKEKKELEKNFQLALEKLNPEQREAVESIEGPVLVVAGPGTGKTQILTLRIANILNQIIGIEAKNILALTFTEAGVQAMRERLEKFIGPHQANQVGIYTFHSFCEEQIHKYPEYFQRISFGKLITEVNQIKIIDDILEKNSFKILKTFNSDFHNSSNVLNAILELKREGVSVKDFEESLKDLKERYLNSFGEEAFYKRNGKDYKKGDIKKEVLKKVEKEVEKQKELLKVYQKYQKILMENNWYDFEDIILEVVREAEINQEFLDNLREEYQYILVDEHQDTNEAQNRIIDLIISSPINEGNPNIFIVGDSKQAIYKFQGANIEEFHRLKNKIPKIKIIELVNNYRSSQLILDASYSLIKQDQPLKAENPEYASIDEKIKLIETPSRQEELIFIAEDIKKKLEEGVNPNEIAVFARNNFEIRELMKIFDKYQLPYKLFIKENILDDRIIKNFLKIIKIINNPLDNQNLGKILFFELFNFDPIEIVRVLNAFDLVIRNRTYDYLFDFIQKEENLREAGVEEVEKWLTWVEKIKELKKIAHQEDFLNFLSEIIEKFDFWKFLLSQKNSVLSLNKFSKLYNLIKEEESNNSDYGLEDFIGFLEILERHNLSIDISSDDFEEGVNLMTAHRSKGLEFEYVYIFNFVEKQWSGKNKRTGIRFNFLPTKRLKGDLEDERRLFYVALTRAKKEIKISWARKEEGKKKENLVSELLKDIDEKFLEVQKIDYDLEKKVRILYQKEEKNGRSIFDKEFIKDLFLKTKLSVSALNNYYKSPIVYFFKNLIKLPSAKAKPMIFGEILHHTLEWYFREKGQKDVFEIFEESFNKFLVPKKYYQDFKEQGKEILKKYFEKYQNQFQFENIYLEKHLKRKYELKNGYILSLSGFADKIEVIGEDGLRVVDYKTGYGTKQKRNDSKDDLKRQLVFYKFLIDGNPDFQGRKVKEGIIDFLEEIKETGELARKKEIIEVEDVEKLKQEIEEFAEDVLSGEFLEREYDIEEFKKKNKYDLELFELWEYLVKGKGK